MRWLEYEEEETIVPSVKEIQFGKPFEKAMVTKRKLQYRQMVDVTIRAGLQGQEYMAKTANYQWSKWQDVPVVKE